MSCHQCAKKLPFSAQKVACPLCKFITCKKCLSYSLPADSGNAKVCLECYERVTSNGPDYDPRETEPPINYLRRIQALKSKKPERLSHSPPRKAVVNDAEKLTLRLHALNAEERKNLPTEAELQSRVDALNDFLLTHRLGPKPTSPLKNDQDEMKSVMSQIQDEARLSTLHGESLDKGGKTSTSDWIYCSLCDNLANILCPACMDEEFCKYCFQRTHKSRHMRHHEGIPIPKPYKN